MRKSIIAIVVGYAAACALLLKERGVLANGINQREMRMVTHKDVSRSDVETALTIVRDVVR